MASKQRASAPASKLRGPHPHTAEPLRRRSVLVSSGQIAIAGDGTPKRSPTSQAKAAAARRQSAPTLSGNVPSRSNTAGRRAEPGHVLIVGGGIIGASTAYYLSLRGVKVTILERAFVACHSSGKAAGQLSLGWNEGATEALAKVSFALHRELAQTFGAATIGYRRMTCVGIGFGGEKPAGERDWLDTTGSEKKFEMGTEADMAQVHPRLLTEALVKASMAEVVTGVASAVERGADGRVSGVRTEDGSMLAADAVVFAMGAWSSQVVAWFPEMEPLLADSVGAKYTSLVWDTVADNTCVYLSDYHIAVLPRPDEIYACGSPAQATLPLDPNDIVPDEEHLQKVRGSTIAVSSHLAKAREKTTQACFLPSSADSRPVLGRIPSSPNAFVACGHTCWGILWAPASGKAMAELIVDGKARCVDISDFDAGREPTPNCSIQ